VLKHQEIIERIEAQHWDYEDSFAPPGTVKVHKPDLIMRKNEHTNHIFFNKVLLARFNRGAIPSSIDVVFDFFGDQPFSWWIGPMSEPADLAARLVSRGMKPSPDEYVGMALDLRDWDPPERDCHYTIIEVSTHDHVRQHAQISAEVWGGGEERIAAAYIERTTYLALPDRRGGFLLAHDEDEPIAGAAWRFSDDRSTLYLTSSAVVLPYRKQGVYNAMLHHRIRMAQDAGAQWVTTQARVGHSMPILERHGFKEYARYSMYYRG
jgi:GNAT superfamily N-acetyltransferase